MKKRITEVSHSGATAVLKDTMYTPRGMLFLQGPVMCQDLKQLQMDEGLAKFRAPKEQQKILSYICQLPEGRVFIARSEKSIVGYITFHLPEFPRWIHCGIEGLIELGGLEVSSNWRGMGIGQKLLDYAFSAHDFEGYIVISMETYCNWDLNGSGMNLWEYRRMLEKILLKVGLERRLTDDPEVTDHPANMLTVRVGSRVPKETLICFEKLLFLRRDSN